MKKRGLFTLRSTVQLTKNKTFNSSFKSLASLHAKNHQLFSSTTTSASSLRLIHSKKTYLFNNNLSSFSQRFYADDTIVNITVQPMGDSISEGELIEWTKQVGDRVEMDEIVGSIETDKATVPVRAPSAGVITELCVPENTNVSVGQTIFKINTSASAVASAPVAEKKAEAPQQKQAPPKQEQAPPKQEQAPPKQQQQAPQQPKKEEPVLAKAEKKVLSGERSEYRVKITKIRGKIAQRLKDSQNTYAMLTTFQECDMYNLVELRNKYKDDFAKEHGVKLGFMSAFVKASAAALKAQPLINAVLEENHILYRDYIDISVAVATPKGLVVPVLRDCDKLSFADIEKKINDLGKSAREGTITLEEMSGGTFTISNGGVYGSMMGTPIINPPQSAILGMHAITDRAVVVNGKIEIRPVMYLALTYDHRLIDGKDAVTFLRRIKFGIEDPRRLLLDL